MARGPKYRVQFRRRREGKTNYHTRLQIVKSRKIRVVIRASSGNTTVQFIESKLQGDKVLVSSFSKELVLKHGWKASTGNMSAAYLTGYLTGLKAKKAGVKDAILDLGVFVHTHRIYAAFKGVLDAGIEVPHDEKIFPEEFLKRIDGSHIEAFAKYLQEQIKADNVALKKAQEERKKLEDKMNKTKDPDDKKELEQKIIEIVLPEQKAQAMFDKNFTAYRASKFEISQFTSHFKSVKSSIEKKV
jgi:large subunit ribosomal protein L18